MLEELSEEHTEAGDLDGIDEENSPDQRPVGVVEQCFLYTEPCCSGAGHDNHTQSGDETDEDEVDVHRSCDPDEIVHPCAKTIDA